MFNLSDKFTQNLKNALYNAYVFAQQFDNKLGSEHLLYALSLQKGSVSAEILNKYKLTSEKIRKSIVTDFASQIVRESYIDIKINNNSLINIPCSPDIAQVIIKMVSLASANKHKYIGTEHCLYALVSSGNEKVRGILKENKINKEQLKEQVSTIFKSTSKFSEITGLFLNQPDQKEKIEMPMEFDLMGPKKAPVDSFATDLTSADNQQKIDPVIGRENEIERVIQILCRRTKNNPVLLGDPGVGKTAIVEGLAKKIFEHAVPDALIGKKILQVDLNSLVAGTSFRGEFENRLKQLVDLVKKDESIILFIDELHNIIGAGSASGSMDAANILKPFLAKGNIRCIGATTYEEYKKHIENDPALERRFQAVKINEPSAEKTVEILNGIRRYYEKYHRVIIKNEAIQTAVELSGRYLHEKYFPDKAIDLIDEACSKIKIKNSNSGIISQIKKTEDQLKKIKEAKEISVKDEDFEKALIWKEQEEKYLQRLAELKEIEQKQQAENFGAIASHDIICLIENITKIPVGRLIQEERTKILNLETLLKEKIIGQDQAISQITSCIQRAKAGISNPNRPHGSFIFLGPSGVGKTHTAKMLAQTVFGQKDSLIKVDMSEFAEKFNVSRLIGSPPGYVGYKEGGKLTEAVRRNPYSVVLFDEIEKAHPEVFNILLQILDEGQLTDAGGKMINFKNCIIIMTSNIGAEQYGQQSAIGFQSGENENYQNNLPAINDYVQKELKKLFKPEFLNRVDKIITFNPLAKEHIKAITALELDKLLQRMRQKNINVEFSSELVEHLAEKNYSLDKGARLIEKNIQEYLETAIAREIIKNEIISQISLQIINGEIIAK